MRDTVPGDRRSNKAMAKEKETFHRRTNWDNAFYSGKNPQNLPATSINCCIYF